MPASVLKLKDYEIHSITTTYEGKHNANIASWVMQTAMKGKFVAVALYQPDYTIELVQQSQILNINLLAVKQAKLLTKLGRKSGRNTDKFKNLPFALDFRGCPYLTEAVGVVHCRVVDRVAAGDHDVFICEVLKQTMLNAQEPILKYSYLLAHGLVRA